ncbi:MAG: ACP S-malonyltransferase, partial [Cetobacterium sp.]
KVEDLKDELYRQSFGPVKWVDTITSLKAAGVSTIYEIGPGKVLNGLIKKIDKEIEVINIEKLSDLV